MTETISILIVEDTESVRQLLTTYLEAKYSCIAVASADEALAILKDNSFNLIITDIEMPGISGLQLCRLVQQAHPSTVVIFASAINAPETILEAVAQGAFDYLVKPFDLLQLSLAIERALRYQALIVWSHSCKQAVVETSQMLRALSERLDNILQPNP